MIREARTAGYRLHICYLALPSVQYSIRRVRERVKKGGHDVKVADPETAFWSEPEGLLQPLSFPR